MVNEDFLKVPVHLDALVVPENRYVLGAMADFSKLPYFNGKREVHPGRAYLSEEVVSHPFQDQSWTMRAGVHLHWALPDGLTHTMNMSIVRRQSFYSVFGKEVGQDIWKTLINKKWISGIELRGETTTAQVANHAKREDLDTKYADRLMQIEQLLAQPTFPAVPNRWLVVRHEGEKVTSSWVVESDYLFNDKKLYDPDDLATIGAVPFPVEAKKEGDLQGVPFRYMGRRVSLDAWEERPASKVSEDYLTDPLTAVGYGEPNFAAFYPNCHSVFGFFDENFGTAPAQLKGVSYTICGWYDQLSRDYFNYFVNNFEPSKKDDRKHNIQLLEAIKRQFGWQLPITITKDKFANLKVSESEIWQQLHTHGWLKGDPQQDKAIILPIGNDYASQLVGTLAPLNDEIQTIINDQIEAQLPQRIVCHAQIEFEDTVSLTPVSTNTNVSVAVGNSGTEALAAYLTNTIEAGKAVTVDQLAAVSEHLEAAQLASQLDNKVLDVGPRFKEGLHGSGFRGTEAGALWTVRKLSPADQKADAEDAHAKGQITLPLRLAHLLNELNQKQQAYNRALDEIESLRHQIYADWCKYMVSIYPPAEQALEYQDADRIKFFMQQYNLPRLNHLVQQTGLLAYQRDKAGTVTGAIDKAAQHNSLAQQTAVSLNAVLAEIKAANSRSHKTPINFQTFADAASSKLMLVEVAKIEKNCLRLTPTGGRGATWFKDKQPVDLPFSTSFQFQISDPNGVGADGFAFVIQNDRAQAIGAPGGGLGYYNIKNCVAIEFDTWQNPDFQDPSRNHIAVITRGAQLNSSHHQYALGQTSDIPNLREGTHRVTIEYLPGRLFISIDDRSNVLVVPLNLEALLNLDNGKAWVGFTAATGSSTQQQDILSWSFMVSQNKQGIASLADKTTAEFVLDQTAAPRYWQPNEPVVLLAGEDAQYTSRHGQDGEPENGGLLVCEISENEGNHTLSNPPLRAELNQMVKNLNQTINKKGIGYNAWKNETWHPFMLEWEVNVFATRDPHAGRFDAAYDARYLNSNFALPVEAVEFQPTPQNKGVIYKPRPYSGFAILTPHVGEKLRTDLERQLLNLVHDAIRKAYDASAPSDQQMINNAAAFNSWLKKQSEPGLQRCSDLVAKAGQTPFQTIQDWLQTNMSHIVAWLKSSAAFSVTEQALAQARKALHEAINAVNPDAEAIEQAEKTLHALNVCYSLRALALAHDALAQDSYLAQGLGGFNDALLGRKRTLQLPIADPLGFQDDQRHQDPLKADTTVAPVPLGDQAFAAAVKTAVLNANRSTPQPHDPFLPFRAGAMNLTRLRLVDTFGRVKEVEAEKLQQVVRPEPLKAIYPRLDSPIGLRPRLVHPARLNFRWLSAFDQDIESNDQPATSPICGWLVPNNLDHSLMVYDQTGAPLGSLYAHDGRSPWRSAPGRDEPLLIEAIENKVLRQVVAKLVTLQQESINADSNYLKNLISTVESAIEHIDPESFARHQARALLLSQPLAVVQAKVSLEMQGLPAVDSSWNSFTHDLYAWSRAVEEGKAAAYRRSDRGYDKVVVPLRLGEYEQLNDGLVGYWTETEGKLKDTFFALQSTAIDDPYIKTRHFTSDPAKPHTDSRHADSDFHLNLSAADVPQIVTMLLDPRGSVHATTGLLPTKEITIPPDQYMAALDNIEVTFLTAPLLTPKDEIAVSLPSEPGYQWRWLGRERGGDWIEVGTVGVLSKAQLAGQFAPTGLTTESVWQGLINAGWITAVSTQNDTPTATITPAEKRTKTKLADQFQAIQEQMNNFLDSFGFLERTALSQTLETVQGSGITTEAAWSALVTAGWIKPLPVTSATVVDKKERTSATLPAKFSQTPPKVDNLPARPAPSKIIDDLFSNVFTVKNKTMTLMRRQLDDSFAGTGVTSDEVWQALLTAGWIKLQSAKKAKVAEKAKRTQVLPDTLESVKIKLTQLLDGTWTLKQPQLNGRFATGGVTSSEVWQALLTAGWIKLLASGKAQVVPSDQRKEKALPERFKTAVDQIETILARTHINPFSTVAKEHGPLEVREGWLKLTKDDPES